MIKKIFIYFFLLVLTTNLNAAKKSKGSGVSGNEGEGEYIPKGPPPAKKYTLGFKEMKRGIKLEKKGKFNKAKSKRHFAKHLAGGLGGLAPQEGNHLKHLILRRVILKVVLDKRHELYLSKIEISFFLHCTV